MTENKGNYDELHTAIKSQKSIQKKEEKNSQLLDSFKYFFNESLDLICISDSESKLKVLNSAFSKLLGYSKKELLNSPFTKFVHILGSLQFILKTGV